MYPGDFITMRNEAQPERKLTVKLYFHAEDKDVHARVAEIVYAIEAGLGEDANVRKYTYVEAVVTDTETRQEAA